MFARYKLAVLLAGAVVLSIGSVRAQDAKVTRASMEQVRGAARALSVDVAHLVEDMQIEMRRLSNAEHLLDDAREAAESAEHLATSFDEGVDVNHAMKDFQEFDETWHHVAGQLRSAGVSRSLQRGVMRVAQADASLHRVLRVPVPVDVQEVRRLAESLAQSAQHLLDDTQQALGRSARSAPVVQVAEDFAEAAEHFSDSIAGGVNVEHARKDFAAVDEAWQALSDRIYALSPYRFEHLQEAASRVAPIVGQLAGTLDVAPEPQPSLPTTALRFDPARGRRTFAPDFDDSLFLPPSCDPATGRCCVPRGLPRRLILPDDDEMHEHSDGHIHSHGPAPSPIPAKPPTPGKAAAKRPAPRTAEPELDDEARANLAKLSPADREAAIAQRTCPVAGDLLGEMGVPIKVRVQGRDVFVCCKGCVAKLQREPEKFRPSQK